MTSTTERGSPQTVLGMDGTNGSSPHLCPLKSKKININRLKFKRLSLKILLPPSVFLVGQCFLGKTFMVKFSFLGPGTSLLEKKIFRRDVSHPSLSVPIRTRKVLSDPIGVFSDTH